MLTHIDHHQQPQMVAIDHKQLTLRQATAESYVDVPYDLEPMMLPQQELLSAKGAVFNTAIIAGTMAVKQTAQMIPLCHQIPIESCQFQIETEYHQAPHKQWRIHIVCKVSSSHKTGVEMEALVGVQVCALTIYDMLKALTHGMVIHGCRLLEKTGGKSDYHA